MLGIDAVARNRGVADQHIGLAARVAEDVDTGSYARRLVVAERTVVDPQQFGSVGPQAAAVVRRRRLGRIVGNHAVVEQRLGSGVDTDGAHADVRIVDDLAVEDVHRRVADENARAVTLVELHAAYRRAAHRAELRRTVLDRESVERSLHAVHLGRRHRNHVAYGVVAVQNRLVRHGIGHGALGRIGRIAADHREVAVDFERVVQRGLHARQRNRRHVGTRSHMDHIAVHRLVDRVGQRGRRLPCQAVLVGRAVGLDIVVRRQVRSARSGLRHGQRDVLALDDIGRDRRRAFVERTVCGHGHRDRGVALSVRRIERHPVLVAFDAPRKVRFDRKFVVLGGLLRGDARLHERQFGRLGSKGRIVAKILAGSQRRACGRQEQVLKYRFLKNILLVLGNFLH